MLDCLQIEITATFKLQLQSHVNPATVNIIYDSVLSNTSEVLTIYRSSTKILFVEIRLPIVKQTDDNFFVKKLASKIKGRSIEESVEKKSFLEDIQNTSSEISKALQVQKDILIQMLS
jgi:hypothetical protein